MINIEKYIYINKHMIIEKNSSSINFYKTSKSTFKKKRFNYH